MTGVAAPVELVCRRRCGYECSFGVAVPSARKRVTPDACPDCGAEVVRP